MWAAGAAGECCGAEMAQPSCLGAKLLIWKELQESMASSSYCCSYSNPAFSRRSSPAFCFPCCCLSFQHIFFVWTHTSASESGQGIDVEDLSNSSVSLVIQLRKHLCQYRRGMGKLLWDSEAALSWCQGQPGVIKLQLWGAVSQEAQANLSTCCYQNRQSLCLQLLCVFMFSPLPAAAALWRSKWAFLFWLKSNSPKPPKNFFWLRSALLSG